MSIHALRVSRALWAKRLRFRQARVGHWKARNDPAKVARWKNLAAKAARMVRRRDQQIKARTPKMSPAALRAVQPGLSLEQARTLAAALGPAFKKYGITSRARAAAAVAQMCEESAGFSTTTEFASGAEYEGRTDLGNTHRGDGVRFKGRGYIQITGRNNYAAVSQAFGVDFLAHPEKLAEPEYAAMASCWWWNAHGCNDFADRGDFVGLTRRINGGTNGLAQREAYWTRAKRVANQLVP